MPYRGPRKLTGFAEEQHPPPTGRAPHRARANIQASAPLVATGLHSTRRTSTVRSPIACNGESGRRDQIRRSRRRRDGRSRHARAPTIPVTAPGDRRRSAPSQPDARPYPSSFGARHRLQARLRRYLGTAPNRPVPCVSAPADGGTLDRKVLARYGALRAMLVIGGGQLLRTFRVGRLLLPNRVLNQLEWFIFAKHLLPSTPSVHVFTDPPYLASADHVYEAIVVYIWSAIWKGCR